MENPACRFAHWGLELQQYDFQMQYRKESSHLVADPLPRQPENVNTVDDLVEKELQRCAAYARGAIVTPFPGFHCTLKQRGHRVEMMRVPTSVSNHPP